MPYLPFIGRAMLAQRGVITPQAALQGPAVPPVALAPHPMAGMAGFFNNASSRGDHYISRDNAAPTPAPTPRDALPDGLAPPVMAPRLHGQARRDARRTARRGGHNGE